MFLLKDKTSLKFSPKMPLISIQEIDYFFMLNITFVEGVSSMEVVATDIRTASVAILPSS